MGRASARFGGLSRNVVAPPPKGATPCSLRAAKRERKSTKGRKRETKSRSEAGGTENVIFFSPIRAFVPSRFRAAVRQRRIPTGTHYKVHPRSYLWPFPGGNMPLRGPMKRADRTLHLVECGRYRGSNHRAHLPAVDLAGFEARAPVNACDGVSTRSIARDNILSSVAGKNIGHFPACMPLGGSVMSTIRRLRRLRHGSRPL